MSLRFERLNSTFQKEISEIISQEVNNTIIKRSMVSINDVDITNDYSYARVYFTILNEDNKNVVLKELEKTSSFIERILFKRVDIAKMPKLQFIYDNSIKEGERIEEIIKNLD